MGRKRVKASSGGGPRSRVGILTAQRSWQRQPRVMLDRLDRPLALKILRNGDEAGPDGHARLLAPRGACDGVAAAYLQSIVHRDLKPSNCFLVRRGPNRDQVEILDFGLAAILGDVAPSSALTASGELHGAPYSMSPEQAKCQKVDARADIYAIGAMLFHCLTGAPPFVGENSVAVAAAHASAPPQEADTLLLRALSKAPQDRFQTVGEFAAALARISGVDEKAETRRASPETSGDNPLLISATEDAIRGNWRDVAMVVWRRDTLEETVRSLIAQTRDLRGQRGRKVALLQVIDRSARPFDRRAGAALADLLKTCGPTVSRSVVVFSGSGFRSMWTSRRGRTQGSPSRLAESAATAPGGSRGSRRAAAVVVSRAIRGEERRDRRDPCRGAR